MACKLDGLSYPEIEQRYKEEGIQGHYKFRSVDEVKKVFGWDFRTIRGYKDLSEEHKELAEKLICNFLNGWGLATRHEQRPTSIKLEGDKFKLNTAKGYSYLYFNGSIG